MKGYKMQLNKETMIQSYSRISHYSERRGAQDFEYYTAQLSEDLEELGENTGNYEEKFISKLMDAFYKQGNCTSSFIVGPANYSIRRHEKAWNSRDKAFSTFEHWRNKYFKAVNRVRTLSPEAELDKITIDIDAYNIMKDKYREIKKCKGLEGRGQLVAELFPKLGNWDKEYLIDRGVTYQIPSLTRKILSRKKKILTMKARIEAKAVQRDIFFEGGKIFIENDRVIISHDERPERAIIQAIKSNGFRWSPKMGNWCRKHTQNARYSADYLLNNVLGGELKQA